MLHHIFKEMSLMYYALRINDENHLEEEQICSLNISKFILSIKRYFFHYKWKMSFMTHF